MPRLAAAGSIPLGFVTAEVEQQLPTRFVLDSFDRYLEIKLVPQARVSAVKPTSTSGGGPWART